MAFGRSKKLTNKNVSKEPKRRSVYKLKGKGKTYVGSTNNPSRRLKEHMKTKKWAKSYQAQDVGPLDSRKAAEGRIGRRTKGLIKQRLPKADWSS